MIPTRVREPALAFRITVSGPCCEQTLAEQYANMTTKAQGLPDSPHFITATPPPTPASSNTDTRTPAVRPRVTLIVPCYGLFYYSLPYPYRVQRPSTSTNSPNVKILQLSWHFRCMLRVANAYRIHTRSLQHPHCAETATNVASKTSCKLVRTVPRPT